MFKTFYEAYVFLENHPIVKLNGLNYFHKCLDIDVVKINPETNSIDNDEIKNTEVEIWLEFGPIVEDEYFNEHNVIPCHDIDLDCGGKTFEEAIINLANLVQKKYN